MIQSGFLCNKHFNHWTISLGCFLFIFCVWVFYLNVIYVYHTHVWCPWRTEKGTGSSETVELLTVWATMWWLGIEPGLLFVLFEARSLCVVLALLVLSVYTRLSSNSQRFSSHSLYLHQKGLEFLQVDETKSMLRVWMLWAWGYTAEGIEKNLELSVWPLTVSKPKEKMITSREKMITSRGKAGRRHERRWLWLHVRLTDTMRNLVLGRGLEGTVLSIWLKKCPFRCGFRSQEVRSMDPWNPWLPSAFEANLSYLRPCL